MNSMDFENASTAAEYDEVTAQELQEVLRHLRNPSRLAQAHWLPTYLSNAQLAKHPEWTPPQALYAILNDAMEHFAKEEPLAADLLRGRYWEGLTVDEMLRAERPQRQSQRRFYLQQKDALQRFARTLNILEQRAYHAARAARLLQALPAAPYASVFGIDMLAASVQHALCDPQAYILCIQGIGGIGKTTLADYAVRRTVLEHADWHKLVWTSAKQQYLTDAGIDGPDTAMSLVQLLDELVQKTGLTDALRLPVEQKIEQLTQTFKRAPHLVVIDNLETLDDLQRLLPLLQRMADPSTFLLTSRQAFHALTNITTVALQELNEADSLRLIEHTVLQKQIGGVDPTRVYALVGGNPLAIQLVVCQMQKLKPEAVLEEVRLGSTEEMYTFIFKKSWSLLDKKARRVLLAIQRAGDQADWEWLRLVLEMAPAELRQALYLLLDLSLLQVYDDTTSRRVYAIHRLTSTFLRTEVLGWK